MANIAAFGDTTFHAGDTVGVHYRLIEKEKVAGKAKREVKEEIRERTQVFEGIVIKIRGEGMGKSFTVRRMGAAAIGIERIFPLNSPWIKKITVKKKGRVRRAKLYYLREKVGKEKEKLKETAGTTKEQSKRKKLKIKEIAPKKQSTSEIKTAPVPHEEKK